MVARSLIAQCALNENVIGRRAVIGDLARRRKAQNQAASGGRKLLGDEHGKRTADRTADDAQPVAALKPFPHLGVVAGPMGRPCRAMALTQVVNNVAVRIENANGRHRAGRKAFLPSRFAQHILRFENRRGAMVSSLQERHCATYPPRMLRSRTFLFGGGGRP